MAASRRRYPLVERLDRVPDAGALARDFVAQGRPVVVRTRSSEAWSLAALRDAFGDALVEAEETGEVYVGERARRRVTLARLVDAVTGGDASLRWKGLDLLASVTGMKEQVARHPPSSDALLPRTTGSTHRALWLAPRGTMSSFHHDGNSDNFNWQIHGRKLFLLVAPSGFDRVYAYGSAESPINPFRPDLARFPRFADAAACEATLTPGDVLLIPKYWWHCVYTLDASVNLNTWFTFRGELTAWQALAGAPLFPRACATLSAELKRRRFDRAARAARTVWYAAYSRLRERPTPEPRGELLEP